MTVETAVVLSGVGAYVPEKRLTNDDLSQIVDTNDEWIRSRTGIRERRIAADGQTTLDMAEQAALQAIERSGVEKEDIGLIVVATMTPDMPFPATACLLQDRLGIGQIMAFDLEAACSGFTYAVQVAEGLLRTGRIDHALVIGADKVSGILDWEDRATCVLFGDGAGAAVLSRVDGRDIGILDCLSRSDGSDPSLLCQPAGGSAMPARQQTIDARGHFLKMRGRDLFKVVVKVVNRLCRDVMERNNIRPEDIRWIIPHQANLRMIDSMAKYLEIPPEKFFVNLERYGNTSAASVPIALEEVISKGEIETGDLILLVAFGAGLTWSATLILWH